MGEGEKKGRQKGGIEICLCSRAPRAERETGTNTNEANYHKIATVNRATKARL